MREVRIAFYLSMFIGFLRNLYKKIVPMHPKHTMWFNLSYHRISIRMYTTSDTGILDRIKDELADAQYNIKMVSIDSHEYPDIGLFDPDLEKIYGNKYLRELQDAVECATTKR